MQCRVLGLFSGVTVQAGWAVRSRKDSLVPAHAHAVLWGSNSTFSPGKPRGRSCSRRGSQQLSQHYPVSCLNRSLLILRNFCSVAVLPDPTNSLQMSPKTADPELCKQQSLRCSLTAGRSGVFSSCVCPSCLTERSLSAAPATWEHRRLFLLRVCLHTDLA